MGACGSTRAGEATRQRSPPSRTGVPTACGGRVEHWRNRSSSTSSQSSGFDRSDLIPHRAGGVDQHYELEGELGQGTFGRVCRGTNKHMCGPARAVKMVPKKKVQDMAQFRKEIEIMRLLDHPNIVRLFESYEDTRCLYLVMELCVGGELFTRIIKAGRFTEQEAANVMQQILRAVFYMHERDISHRDLKPENFLFKTKDPIEDNVLKIIDFGLSCHSKPGTVHTQIAGSAQYVAPQVLRRRYDRMCDMWSCGVIMYTLLCGQSPFHAANDEQIMAKVRTGGFSFNGRNWAQVSNDAKDLIRHLLKMQPSLRYTADQALSHEWIRRQAPRAQNVPLEDGFLENLRDFREKSTLKKAALHVIALHMEDSNLQRLRETFTALDAKGDGCLCINELMEGLERAGLQEVPADLEQILEGVDVNGSGVIDYTEFLAASLDRQFYQDEDACRSAFSAFDRDGDGVISKRELTKVLDADAAMDAQELTDLSGGMDFQDFLRLMRSERGLPFAGQREQGASGETAVGGQVE